MYLLLRFQNNFLTPLRLLYGSFFLFIVLLLSNPQVQADFDAWLHDHGRVVLMVKIVFLAVLAASRYKRLALTVAMLAIGLTGLGFSLAASTSCIIIISVLLLFTLLVEIIKLISIDRYYENKQKYDALGVVASFGLILALV